MGSARRLVWLAPLVLALIAAGTVAAYFAWGAWHAAKLKSDADAGLTAMYRGDYQSAQNYLTQAVNETRDPETRAGYEILLAGSLENDAPQQAADRYLDVIDQGALSEQTRAQASIYLLIFLNARHDAAFTEGVFARSPWSTFYQPLKPDEDINAELAIIKAHEAILTTYPNFLSYLLAGEFYARKYPYMTGGIAHFRPEYARKATIYFSRGVAMLRDARDSQVNDETRLALGYAYATTYAVELFDDGLSAMDDRTLWVFYLEAAGFADQASAGEPLMESARFSIRLAYAGYLSAHKATVDPTRISIVANGLAPLATEPANQPVIAKIMSAPDPTSKYGRLKAPILFMASSSPALAKVLTNVVIQSQ